MAQLSIGCQEAYSLSTAEHSWQTGRTCGRLIGYASRVCCTCASFLTRIMAASITLGGLRCIKEGTGQNTYEINHLNGCTYTPGLATLSGTYTHSLILYTRHGWWFLFQLPPWPPYSERGEQFIGSPPADGAA